MNIEQVTHHETARGISGTVHIPVLFAETMAALGLKEGGAVIDGTCGGGGHSAGILARIGPSGRLLAIDWNEHAVRGCSAAYDLDRRVTCAMGNFGDIKEIARLAGFPPADALLLDLGISSDELMHSGRGFSFQEDEPLMMTYNDAQEPVADLLRDIEEDDLTKIIRAYGEERYAGRIARAIKERGRAKPVETTGELAAIVERAVPRPRGGYSRIHPATRTFMALRIFANEELENVKQIIKAIPGIMAPGGRVAMISFHSLEDRIVKHSFRELAKEKGAEVLTKKPIVANEEEVRANPRSRSAKLRAIVMGPSPLSVANHWRK